MTTPTCRGDMPVLPQLCEQILRFTPRAPGGLSGPFSPVWLDAESLLG
jgi:hypothetical protein